MSDRPEPPDLIGEAPSFLAALDRVSAAAALDRPLLIVGERGTGKELLAARAHLLSPRWDGPLVKVNCAALADDLLENELFGHEAGAFTGAQRRLAGRFERADGGALFLDEIASASLRVQEKLLRVIEYGEFDRLGGEKTLRVDVRVIAAANADLPALAAAGTFRADLLDRLAFDVVRAPPLRERREDIPRLAAHFAGRLARETGTTFAGFGPAATAALLAHGWPGNVRELKNVAERSFWRWTAEGHEGPVDAVSIDPFAGTRLPTRPGGGAGPETGLGTGLGKGREAEIGAEAGSDPDPEARAAGKGAQSEARRPAGAAIPADLRAHLDAVEKAAAEAALAASGGAQAAAAKRLGLSYHQMRGLVRKHGLSGAGRKGRGTAD